MSIVEIFSLEELPDTIFELGNVFNLDFLVLIIEFIQLRFDIEIVIGDVVRSDSLVGLLNVAGIDVNDEEFLKFVVVVLNFFHYFVFSLVRV